MIEYLQTVGVVSLFALAFFLWYVVLGGVKDWASRDFETFDYVTWFTLSITAILVTAAGIVLL